MDARVCVYDNPETMRREAWRDGKLVCFATADLLLSKGFKGDDKFDFRLNCGPWKKGAFWVGGETAMRKKKRGGSPWTWRCFGWSV